MYKKSKKRYSGSFKASLATGPPGPFSVADPNAYTVVFAPRLGASICFPGYARPTIGAIPPTAEMQARWFARIVSGERTLPTVAEMEDCVARQCERSLVELSHRADSALVQWIPYLDSLASEVDCRPDPLMLLRDPILAWRLMTSGMTGFQYRLSGHGARPGPAREALMGLPRTFGLEELLAMLLLNFYSHIGGLFSGSSEGWGMANTFI